jgi:hypothetical protein
VKRPDQGKLFVALAVVYFLISLGHFSHNTEFICEYPNLPAWLTRTKVYAAWMAITSVAVLGFFLIRKRFIVAPMDLHTFGANLTILSEVAAAALLLWVTNHVLTLQLVHRVRHGADT